MSFNFILFIDDLVDEAFIANLLRFCQYNKAVSTIALSGSALEKNVYYTFEMFPKFFLIEKLFDWSLTPAKFFPDYENLNGHALRVCAIDSIPQSYVYVNINGKEEVGGIYGSLITEYARHLNGSLTFPRLKRNRQKIIRDDCIDHLEKDHFDVGSFTIARIVKESDIILTYPVELSSLCVAVPYGEHLPHYKYFLIILHKEVLLLMAITLFTASVMLHLSNEVHGRKTKFWIYLFDLNFISLVLGLTVSRKKLISGKGAIPKIIFIVLTLTGTIFSTAFIAFLQSFTAENPRETTIKTLPELLRSGLKIYIQEYEYNNIKNYATDYKIMLPYLTKFRKGSYANFNGSLLNQAFVVGDYDWKFFNERMEMTGQRTHVLSNMCPFKNVAKKLPAAPNSIYVKYLSRYLVYIFGTGLLDYWFHRDFLKHNDRNINTFNFDSDFDILQLEDLRVICMIYGIGIMIAVIVFAGELYCNKRQKLIKQKETLKRIVHNM